MVIDFRVFGNGQASAIVTSVAHGNLQSLDPITAFAVINFGMKRARLPGDFERRLQVGQYAPPLLRVFVELPADRHAHTDAGYVQEALAVDLANIDASCLATADHTAGLDRIERQAQ